MRTRMIVEKLSHNLGPHVAGIIGWPRYFVILGNAVLHLPVILRTRSLRTLDAAAKGRIPVQFLGRRIEIDLAHYQAIDEDEGTWTFGAIREMFFRDVYFWPFEITSWQNALDLGANRGIVSLLLASNCTKVVSVEYNEKYRVPMLEVLADNDLHNVDLINGFVGGKGLVEPEGSAMSMEHLFGRFQGASVDFVKIDIEGSEFALFEAPFWLDMVKRIAVEVHPQYGSLDVIIGALEAAGFDIRLAREDLRSVTTPAETAFVYGVNRNHEDVRWRGSSQ